MAPPGNGKILQAPEQDQMLRAQAIIQSLEQMCTDSRTRELHKDAAIAVLRDQLQKCQQEVAALKQPAGAAKLPKPASKGTAAVSKA